MSDEDCETLGFNPKFARPDWLVLTVFPVPPPPVRPSVMMDGANRCVPCSSNIFSFCQLKSHFRTLQQSCQVGLMTLAAALPDALLLVQAMCNANVDLAVAVCPFTHTQPYKSAILVHPGKGKIFNPKLCRCEDDLTHKLAEIVKANNRLRRQEENGAPQHIIRDFSQLLQFHITTYLDNTVPGQPIAQQRSGRPIKSISQRLKVNQGFRVYD